MKVVKEEEERKKGKENPKIIIQIESGEGIHHPM
jgi:hypothetical protein